MNNPAVKYSIRDGHNPLLPKRGQEPGKTMLSRKFYSPPKPQLHLQDMTVPHRTQPIH